MASAAISINVFFIATLRVPLVQARSVAEGPRCGARPRQDELQALVERVAERIGRALERQGLLARDAEESYLDLDPEAGGPLDDLIGHSITYRVAIGPRGASREI
jgi:hypothetical protein